MLPPKVTIILLILSPLSLTCSAQNDNVCDFEKGGFYPDWVFEGSSWQKVEDSYPYGNQSITTGEVSCPGTTNASIDNVQGPGYISFYWKKNQDYAKFQFYIDNKSQRDPCNSSSWQLRSYSVPEGNHTVKWVFSLDRSGNKKCPKGSSAAGWIDTVSIPGRSSNLSKKSEPIIIIKPKNESENAILKLQKEPENKSMHINEAFRVDPINSDPIRHVYPTIQQAVNNATAGSSISIANGEYLEDLVIDKPLTIIGDDVSNTIIKGKNIAVNIKSDNVSILKLTIKNGKKGVFATGRDNISIIGTNMQSNTFGDIVIDDCKNSLITDNILNGMGSIGIYILSSSNLNITNNKITYQKSSGIKAELSENITINSNDISNNGIGLDILDAEDFNIQLNNIDSSNDGISAENCERIKINSNNINMIKGTDVYLLNSNKSIIINNRLHGEDTGTYLAGSSNNIIEHNKFENTIYGIYLYPGSYANTIKDDNIFNIKDSRIICKLVEPRCCGNNIIPINIARCG